MISMKNISAFAPKPITIFPFGKYSGERVDDIIEVDPGYVLWWNKNIDGHPIPKAELKVAVENYVEDSLPKSSMYDGCFDPWDFGSN